MLLNYYAHNRYRSVRLIMRIVSLICHTYTHPEKRTRMTEIRVVNPCKHVEFSRPEAGPRVSRETAAPRVCARALFYERLHAKKRARCQRPRLRASAEFNLGN